MSTIHIEPQRALIELKHLHPWERNPRGAELRGMEAFTEQLREEGIRDDLHVFRDAHGLLVLMQGHRRRAAAEALGIEKLWCKVWPFDEGQAFRHLMTMQNGADPFTALELARGAREALRMGIPKEELPGIMHRSMEQIDLYLCIEKLPPRAQQMVEDQRLSLESAGLLSQLKSDQVREMMGDIINPFTKEVYSYRQLKDYVNQRFVKPEKQQMEWQKMASKWKLRVIENNAEKPALVQTVPWEDREEYVHEQAVKQTAYELAHEWLPTEKLASGLGSIRWWDLAAQYDVTVMMAPAMEREGDKYLLLVNRAVVEAADSLALVPMLRKNAKKKASQHSQDQQTSEDAGKDLAVDDEMGEAELSRQDKAAVTFDLERWRRMHARLMLKPEAAMQNSLWETLMGMQWEALAEILPKEAYASIMGELNRDGVKRKGLRWCLLACVALALCAEDEESLRSVEEGVGLGDATLSHEEGGKEQL